MLSTHNDTSQPQRVPLDLVSASAWLAGSILGCTWRFLVTGSKEIDLFQCRDKGVIFCFWHAHILPLSYIFRGVGVTAVVSASKDGDRATAVAQRWNHETIRGSSSRGQIAVLRQCVRALQNGRSIVIVPDGPRGPALQAKPGAAMLALMTNAPVFPVLAIPEKMWRLKSWDRFMVPKPFSPITIHVKEPLRPQDFPDEKNRIEVFSRALQQALTL
jgi:lysophospholipid acyltransferase (LPLAT)-like uncharacterized protein